MTTYKNLTISEFDEAIRTKKDIEVLDVRTESEFNSGHLEMARNLPDIRTEIEKLDPSKHYYLHCRVGGRSAIAAQMLALKGFNNVYNLNGELGHTSLPLVKE